MAVIQKDVSQIAEAEKKEILRQAERLIASRHFSGSKRYPAFLRFVVQEALDGRQETLKERTLGIAIFEREPSFDTSADSIVRVTAAEVRKRIAQYYQDDGHETEMRIELPPGSYVPHFRVPGSPLVAPGPRPPIAEATRPASATSLPVDQIQRPTSRFKTAAILVSAVLVVGALVAFGLNRWAHSDRTPTILASFWNSQQPVMICIGSPALSVNQPGAEKPGIAAALGPPTTNNTLVPLSDAITLGQFQAILHARRKQYRVLLARQANLDDLRSGPTILIAGLDNPWTMRLTSRFRYQFRGSESTQGAIVDTKSNAASQWNVSFLVPYSDRTQDYAIVAQTHDDTIGQPLLIASGVGPNGTRAVGEFLTNEDDLASLKKLAPAGWRGENFEVVLATQVIQGNSGPPRVLAAEFW